MSSRALKPEDKQRKRETILDAAFRLWHAHPDNITSMDELARASGVAKGTLYLYFKSKEEVLLAMHERDMQQFFERLLARAQQNDAMQLEEMGHILLDAIRNTPTFLPLSNLCTGLLERQLPADTALAFRERISQQLEIVVNALQTHFPHMTCLKMMQGHALILGLWQLMRQDRHPKDLPSISHSRLPCDPPLDEEHFLRILHNALCTLFSGLLAQKDDPL